MLGLVEIIRASIGGRLRRHPRLDRTVRRFAGAHAASKDDIGYIQTVYAAFAPLNPGGRTLEIGPGSNLGVSLLLARDGCEAVAIDQTDLRTPCLDSLYGRVIESTPIADGDCPAATPGSRYEAASLGHAATRGAVVVRFLRSSVECLPFAAGSFDFVFSNASFEHFRDPMAAVAEMRRVLRPGGRTAHQIDLRDHRHLEDAPLRFLRYGERTWNLMTPPGPSYMNRWRLSQYVAAFAAHGFHVEVTVNQRATAVQLEDLRAAAPRFRRMSFEDATALSCMLVADAPP